VFTARYGLSIYNSRYHYSLFDPRPVHVGLVNEVALWQVSVPITGFSPVSIISPSLHNHLRLHVAVTRSLGALKQSNALSQTGQRWAATYCPFVFKGLAFLLVLFRYTQ
jgi:hypothetical protein